MALLGAINTASSQIGEGLSLVDSLFQQQVTIRSVEESVSRFGTAFKTDDIVLLNIVKNQELDFVVEISEKPVADLGGAVDYISRTPTPLVLDAIISNRNLDLLQDPTEFILQHAGAFIPELLNVINQSSSIAGQFFDLGQDEIDKKIATLVQWQNDVVPVEVLGLRLDAQKLTALKGQFTFFIERITATVSKETGDNVGVVIQLKNLLNVTQAVVEIIKGAKLSEVSSGTLPDASNPFSG